ncbi:MAG: sigma-70 family RNA polymerase sigma factor [Bacteroidota bacterium]
MPKTPLHPDKSALKKVALQLAEGQQGAIGQLYRWFFQRLVRYGVQIVGMERQDLVKTTVQDFFMWLVEHPQRLKEVDNIERFILKSIRTNLIQAQIKQQKKQQVRNDYQNHMSQKPTSPNASPEKILIDQEEQFLQKKQVINALNSLPPVQREVLYLRYFQDLSYRDIAALLEVDEQVARNYGYRALKKLRK